MGRSDWARAAQFNWVFDNMGGTPLQEAVAGAWQGATAQVGADGRITLAAPNPGGGQVYFIRGIYLADTVFPWSGFWAEPMSGDLSNYYQGGFFVNQGETTVITLGTSLPSGTSVQLYYIYLTGDQAAKYEALNNYPCIRRASRARDDYTYDFAVDRMLDLMVCLHFAEPVQGKDYTPLIQFLWEALVSRQESRTSPLLQDSFERRFWDRGAHLMYRGASTGTGAFQVFQSEAALGGSGRMLHVRATLPTSTDAAWFGYGLDWSLAAAPFNAVDRLSFKLEGLADTRRGHNLTKIGSGSATLVLRGDYSRQEKRRFVVQIQSSGAVGAATFRWSKDGGLTWEAEGLVSGDKQHPVALWAGLSVYWEAGSGTHLVAGDYWSFWAGEPAAHPRRLLVALNDSTPDSQDPWGPAHTYVHAIPDRFAELTSFELPFSQFWRRDNLIDDGDRVTAGWGAWYSTSQQDTGDITIGTREETEVLFGETFYTQRLVTWSLSSYATAFGVWVGLDPGRCSSTGHSQVNFLLKAVVAGVSSLTIRVKVKDAQGSYFHKDVTIPANAWQRVTVVMSELQLESGSTPLTHPLQVVDIGIPASPPSNGVFYLTDLKFDEHLTFAGASHLRTLEFKMEQQGLDEHEWWLDDVSLNLEAQDPYPYAPRLAISLTSYGQNPWRGPTPVHYAQPLAPQLAGAASLVQTYVALHRDAQDEFYSRYSGLKGPILPVHTRNDVENIALCGCEDFGRFSWWPRYRNYGKMVAAWPFNGALADASGRGHTLTWQGGGAPVYAAGICQPGNTTLALDGSHYVSCPEHPDFDMTGDFTIEMVFKAGSLSGVQGIISKLDSAYVPIGYLIALWDTELKIYLAGGGNFGWHAFSPAATINDTDNFHYLALTRSNNQLSLCLDGTIYTTATAVTGSLNNNGALLLGLQTATTHYFTGNLDLVRLHQDRALPAVERQDRRQIIQGQLNGSAYPEVGCGLGQYWALMRLGQYYFVSGDAGAWAVLDNWLTWIDTYGAADGSGWKFPTFFSEYGFGYGDYDPGMAASIAIGCLYCYMKNGDSRANTWARRILDDLRLNRQDPNYGGYQSDRHYGWLNALVLQASGLAVNGASGQAYCFPALPEDRTHFEALMTWIMTHTGDAKPNVLNGDLIPFIYSEAGELWDYAPNYLAAGQMGSLEALVQMLAGALEYGKLRADWEWFNRLISFILRDNLVVLSPMQIRSVTAAFDEAGAANLVRLRYADYDADSGKYCEARDQAAIDSWGEQALDLDFRYGSPVILEDPVAAQLLASRLLQRLATPQESAAVETWLEGVRIELGDTVAVSSDFHGWDREKFTVLGKDLDLGQRRINLKLTRPLDSTVSWAVEAAGSAWEAWAIDQASSWDENWDSRAYVY